MKRLLKFFKIIVVSFFLFGCAGSYKDKLYHHHLEALLSGNYEDIKNLPFVLHGSKESINEKNKVTIIVDNARQRLNDFTLMFLEYEAVEALSAPLNVGYFNKLSINFVKDKIKENDQIGFRFVFYSDSLAFKFASSFILENKREEIYFNFCLE